MDENRSMDFTNKAWDVLYDAVDNNYFRDKDAHLIYSALQKRMKFISGQTVSPIFFVLRPLP